MSVFIAVEDLTSSLLLQVRGDWWRREFLREFLREVTSGYVSGDFLQALQDAGLGGVSDLGLVVGYTSESVSGTLSETYMLALGSRSNEQSTLVRLPLGAAHLLVSTAQRGARLPGVLGHRRQLVPLPGDLTPEMEEVILGLFDPDSPGPLSHLPSVVVAARRISAS